MEDEKPGSLKMEDVKGITPAVFGFLIAYLLPGLFGVITLGLYFGPVATVLLGFSNATSSTGLSILLFLTALLVGMQLNIVRWAVFEELVLRKRRLKAEDIAKLRASDKAAQFQVFSRSDASLSSVCWGAVNRNSVFWVRRNWRASTCSLFWSVVSVIECGFGA